VLARGFLDATLWRTAFHSLPSARAPGRVVLCREAACAYVFRQRSPDPVPLACVFHGQSIKMLRFYYPWLEGSPDERRIWTRMSVGLRGADRVVVVPPDTRREALGLCPDLDPERVAVVPNGLPELTPPPRHLHSPASRSGWCAWAR
jgi:hypothetical protein